MPAPPADAPPAEAAPLPGPSPWEIPGLILRAAQDPTRLMERAARYGDAVRVPTGRTTWVLQLSHPDHFRHVLVANARNYRKGELMRQLGALTGDGLLISEGERWREQRRRWRPVQESTPALLDDILAGTDDLLSRWGALPDGAAVPLFAEMARLTLRNVTGGLLGASDEGGSPLADPKLAEDFDRLLVALVRQNLPVYRNLPDPDFLALPRARDRVEALMRWLDERPGAGPLGGWWRDPGPGERLREEVMTLLIAGHATLAATLAWAWHRLGHHPDALAAAQREVDRVLGKRAPTLDDLPKLVEVERVLHEVLRLYPQPPMLSRQAIGEDRIGDHAVPAGTELVLSTWVVHRDPRFWEDPGSFQPQRFADGRAHPAYFPFGAGSRICAGRRFALLEATAVLAVLLQRYEPEPAAPLAAPVRTIAGALRPRGPLPVRLRRR